MYIKPEEAIARIGAGEPCLLGGIWSADGEMVTATLGKDAALCFIRAVCGRWDSARFCLEYHQPGDASSDEEPRAVLLLLVVEPWLSAADQLLAALG